MPASRLPIARALLLGALALGSGAAHAQPVVNLPAADRPLAGRPAAVFSVGSEDGADWEVFSSVGAVAFDATENLYVLDRGNHRVLVFDPRGRYVRRIGRRGQGPGELMGPIAMTVTRAGEVVVADLGRRAYSVFGTDGSFLRNVAFPEAESLTGSEMQPHPRGGIVSATRAVAMPRTGGGRSREGTTVAWHPLDAQNREVALFDGGREQTRSTDIDTPGRGATRGLRMTGAPMFSPGVHWAVLPTGGIAVASTPRYAIRLTDAAGRAVRVFQRPISPRAVTARDRAAARDRLRRSLTTGEGGTFFSVDGSARPQLPPQMVEQHLAGLEFAAQVPVIREIASDAAGRLWVQRTAADGSGAGPVDLLAADGRYLGTLPAGTPLPDAFSARGRAAYVERDEMGVERVIVRTLLATWR